MCLSSTSVSVCVSEQHQKKFARSGKEHRFIFQAEPGLYRTRFRATDPRWFGVVCVMQCGVVCVRRVSSQYPLLTQVGIGRRRLAQTRHAGSRSVSSTRCRSVRPACNGGAGVRVRVSLVKWRRWWCAFAFSSAMVVVVVVVVVVWFLH